MNAQADRDDAIENRSRASITAVYRLLGLLVDCESGLRGYAATGMPIFTQAYDRAVGHVPEEMARLRSLAPQRTRLLESLVSDVLAYHRDAMSRLRRGERAAVLEDIAHQQSKRRIDAVRASAAGFLDAEEAELAVHNRTANAARNRLDLAAACGAATVIALTAMLAYAFTADVVRRLCIVRENTLRLEHGQPLHPPDDRADEIAAVDRSFHEMAEALRRERAELEAFSYSVSHDLRAPLRAVSGFAEILAEDHAQALDAGGVAALQSIRSEARRMGILIDDLLAFSRFGKTPLSLATIDVADLVREVWPEVAPNGAVLDVGALPKARGDRTMIRQVFVNLLSNAVKFSRNADETRVEVGGRADGGSNVYWVRDHGAGFDMRYAGKLFGVFQRLHTQEEFEGTGVGLAIVARVVARHGGRVWADAAPGAGACFSFTLPAAEEKR